MSWTTLLLFVFSAASPDQPELSLDAGVPALLSDVPATRIVVLEDDLEDAWLEATHLASDLPPVLARIDRRSSSEEPFIFVPDLPPGPTMVCAGARSRGVLCEEVYRGADEFVGLPDVLVELVAGLEVRGVFLQDLDPVPRTRVALVPARMQAFRPFTMPLGVRGRRVVREVLTDREGRFELPEIAPGDYFLEAVLPAGRVHRTDPFTVPDRDALRRNFEVDEGLYEPGELFWDLGRIDVPSGLDVELRVLDATGDPIAGAAVSATQGRTPPSVLNFEGTSDAEGRVLLHGLDIEQPVRLTCEKKGYEPFAQEYELLPVAVDCVLRSWARVSGEVVSPGGVAPRRAVVTVRRVDGDALPTSVGVSSDATFLVDRLTAGGYELRVAAPGFRVEERSFTVDFGQDLDLGTILVLFAREIEGTVVDAETGEGVAGVDILSLTPPGAVEAFSDVDGEFRFGVDTTEPLELEFSTFDYAARRITLADLDFDEPLVVELVPAGWIMAIVEADGGGRCQGCRVVLWPGNEELWTDGVGEALSGPLEAGTYRVSRPRVTHFGSTVVEQPEAEMYRVRVRPGKLSVVRLRSEGKAVRVRFEGDLEGTWMLSARSRRRVEKSYADDDGIFPVRQRDGETLELFLHTYDEELGAEIAVWQATLPPGLLSDRFSVRLSRSFVHGQAVGFEGPLAGAEVRLVNFVDASLKAVVYTYPDGTFRIPQVRPGVYNLYIGPRSVKFVSIGDRQTVDLGRFQLFFDDPGNLRGY